MTDMACFKFGAFFRGLDGYFEKKPVLQKVQVEEMLRDPDEQFIKRLAKKRYKVAVNVISSEFWDTPCTYEPFGYSPHCKFYFSDGSQALEEEAYCVACLSLEHDPEQQRFNVTSIDSVQLRSQYPSHNKTFAGFSVNDLANKLKSFSEEQIFGESAAERLQRAVRNCEPQQVSELLSSYSAEGLKLNKSTEEVDFTDEMQQDHPQLFAQFSSNFRTTGGPSSRNYQEFSNTNTFPILFYAVLMNKPISIIQPLVAYGADQDKKIRGYSARDIATILDKQAICDELNTPKHESREGPKMHEQQEKDAGLRHRKR